MNKRIIISGIVGNLLEAFDVMVCLYLAKMLSVAFFPATTGSKNLLYTFIIFSVSYISRPIGSIVIGLYADQIGRKKMLAYSLLITGICTALIGALPTHESIGYLATALFIFLRIMQNFSVGGEYISSISYLIESAEKHKRGFYGSMISVGYNGGVLLASLAVYVVVYGMEKGFLPESAWRGVFFCALVGTVFGYWIRRSLPESLAFILNNPASKVTSKFSIFKSSIDLIRLHPRRCLALMVIAWFGIFETAVVFVCSPMYMTSVNHFSQSDALAINTLSLVFLTLIIPIFGYYYDRLSKVRTLIIVTIILSLGSPAYFYYLSVGSYEMVLFVKLLASVPSACYYVFATVLMTESFPVKVRCTSMALIYQIISSIAGGLTPILMLQLSTYQNANWLVTGFSVIASFVCLIGLWSMRQPAGRREGYSQLDNDLSFNEVR